jgi:predicted GIY-YIG superfamily endonuclease
MSLFSTSNSVQPPCTNIVHRPLGGIASYREIHDDVSRLSVAAFPMAMAKDIAAAKAAMAAAYILADHETAYIGETANFGRRILDHAADPSKAFAREVYVVCGYEHAWFDKTAAIYLQYRLTEIADNASLVEVVRGVNPQVLELPSHRRAPFDRYVDDAERLLFDAGCRVLRSNFAGHRQTPQAIETETAIGPDETGPMQIGVISTPSLGSELELAYVGIWARGYPAQDGFVVMAGSEVRTVVNQSVNPILHTRRAELVAAKALAEIPGIGDRVRLRVAVWFPSAAIAAKVVTGAHVDSSKWVQPRYPQPILIAT